MDNFFEMIKFINDIGLVNCFVALGTILSPAIALGITLKNFKFVKQCEQKKRLDDLFNTLLTIAINKPEFEDNLHEDKFKNNTRLTRLGFPYENYCYLVFYYFKELYIYYNYKFSENDYILFNKYYASHYSWIDENINNFSKMYGNRFAEFVINKADNKAIDA